MSYLRLRHICLVSPDLEKAAADLTAMFDVRVAFRDPIVEQFGIDNVIVPFGLSFLEIVSPRNEAAAAARFLDRSEGRGAYVAVFNCDNLWDRQKHLETLGLRIVERWDKDDFALIQLHPRDARGVMVEFDRSPGEKDLRGNYVPAGGLGWVDFVRTDLTVGMPEVVLESPDPAALGLHWSNMLQRPCADDEDGRHIDVDMCRIRFVRCPPYQRECLRTVVVEVTDPARVTDQAIRLRYPVFGDMIAFCGILFQVRAAG